MDGKTLLEKLRQVLNEDSTSTFIDNKTSYWYLWEAAKDFVSRTGLLKSEQSITTVTGQSNYTLNTDFGKLYLKNRNSNFIIKYNDGSTNNFLEWKDYEKVIYEDSTDAVDSPTTFTILDSSLSSQITGSATSSGALSAGQAILTDSTADFTNVSAGDTIHNTTDASDGIVLSKTSSTVLVTALFGGVENDWDISDAYVVQPQGRLRLILNPPPSTSGHTVTVYYTQIPLPVFSDYGIYRFNQEYCDAIVKYASWLYKYKDREPNFGDMWFKFYDDKLRRSLRNTTYEKDKNSLKVSFRSR